MRKFLLVAFLASIAACFAPAFAVELVARHGADEVRLFDGPCVSAETLARIPPERRAVFRKLTGRVQGQTYFGCWTERDGIALIVWEDGDRGMLPLGQFEEAKSI